MTIWNQQTMGKILKGLYSAAVAGLGSLGAALGNNEPISQLTASQVVWIALASLVAFGGTFGLAGWTGPRIGNGNGGGGGSGG